MSAWLCSQTHLSAIATVAADLLKWQVADVGKVLAAENVRSLQARYGHMPDYIAECQQAIDGYTYRTDVGPGLASLVKQCDCFDYQACETDDYRQTPAAKIVDVVRASALRQLGWPKVGYEDRPEWKAAPWGLDDPEEAAA